jgi:hypothetical protein
MNIEQANIHVISDLGYKAARALCACMIALGLAFIIGGVYVFQITSAQAAAPSAEVRTITAATLEETFGLQVKAIAVTAEGKMVEFRLRVIDAEKAQQILADPARMPRLIVPDKGLTLSAPPSLDRAQSEADGEEFILLFGNKAETVKPGTFVIVSFGEFQLERLPAE